MLPRSSTEHRGDGYGFDAVTISNVFVKFSRRPMAFSNFSHQVLGQFHVRLAMFLYAIANIVAFCAKKQMPRINASRVVAVMEHAKIVGDVSKVNCPRNSVRKNMWGSPTGTHHPISLSVLASRPNPAPFKRWAVRWNGPRLIDLFPKASNVFFSHNQAGILPIILT